MDSEVRVEGQTFGLGDTGHGRRLRILEQNEMREGQKERPIDSRDDDGQLNMIFSLLSVERGRSMAYGKCTHKERTFGIPKEFWDARSAPCGRDEYSPGELT